MPFYLGITVVLPVLVCSTNGFCCYEKCQGGISCTPAAGTSCNIFCCNCGKDHCGPDCLKANRRKDESTPKGDAIRGVFNTIDGNHDNVLDLKEALAYYTNHTKSSRERMTTKGFGLEFKKMDANKNGIIEPREFDVSLA